MSAALFRLEQVNVQGGVGAAAILRNLTLQVNQGDRLAIVGAAGSGKSTLLRLFNRLRDASSGTVWFEQQAIAQYPVTALRQRVVLVPQEPKLLGMTVRQALSYPLTLRQMPAKAVAQLVEETIEAFLIPGDWLDRTEVQLALGQRQWVAIARACISSPQVLLLDEPTMTLDGGRSQQIQMILRSRSITVIMVNRQLDWVREGCDRVVYLHRGTIAWEAIAPEVDWTDLERQIRMVETQELEDWAL